MTTQDYNELVEYYSTLIVKDKCNEDRAKDLLYQRCITHSDIGYKYVDGLESFEEYDLKINKVVNKIINSYASKSN